MNNFLAIFVILWPALLSVIVLKFFPDVLGNLLVKHLEQSNAKQLATFQDGLDRSTALVLENNKIELTRRMSTHIERSKAELLATYSTLQTSVSVIAAGQTGMREETIKSVQRLWATIHQLRSDFGGLVQLTVILLPAEMLELVQGGGTAAAGGWIHKYRDDKWMTDRSISSTSNEIDEARLFCGDKLWLIFYVSRAAYLRLAWLMVRSIKQKNYTDWRTDKRYISTLEMALDNGLMQEALSQQHPGLSALFDRLEADFVHEASRVMSGSKALSDSLADMQAVMLVEKDRLANLSRPEDVAASMGSAT